MCSLCSAVLSVLVVLVVLHGVQGAQHTLLPPQKKQATKKITSQNAFYVQLPTSHSKTATPSGCGRLYRVLRAFRPLTKAFTA